MYSLKQPWGTSQLNIEQARYRGDVGCFETPDALHEGLRVLGSDAHNALVGDQLFTDILGGNLVGFYTVLVDPIVDREFLTTRLLRRLERVVRKRLGLVRRSV